MAKTLEKHLWKSSIFIKAVGWSSEALLTMNFFMCILMILTTSGVQQLEGVQENSCSAPVDRILENICKRVQFFIKLFGEGNCNCNAIAVGNKCIIGNMYVALSK